jgi:hypothetical protein
MARITKPYDCFRAIAQGLSHQHSAISIQHQALVISALVAPLEFKLTADC